MGWDGKVMGAFDWLGEEPNFFQLEFFIWSAQKLLQMGLVVVLHWEEVYIYMGWDGKVMGAFDWLGEDAARSLGDAATTLLPSHTCKM